MISELFLKMPYNLIPVILDLNNLSVAPYAIIKIL